MKITCDQDVSVLKAILPQAKTVVLKNSTNFSVTQSNAILRMIAELSPRSELYGKNEFQSALVDQWVEFSRSELEIPAAICTFPSRKLLPKHDGAIKLAKQDLEKALSVVDAHLKERTFMVGDRVTLADISIVCLLRTVACEPSVSSLLSSTTTNLIRWFHTCLHQPQFEAIVGTGPISGAAPLGAQLTSTSPEPSINKPENGVVTNLAKASVPAGRYVQKFGRSRIRIKEMLVDARQKVGSTVTVKGWVRTMRSAQKGQLLFVELNDGSCFSSVQIVMEQGIPGFEDAGKCGGAGASLSVTGVLVESPAVGQEVELKASKCEVLGIVMDPKTYPLSKKFHTMEHLREIAHLRARTKIHSTVMRIRHQMAYATHQFFHERGFLYVHTPLITSADCEGAGEQFIVTTLLGEETQKKIPRQKNGDVDFSQDFFGRQTCLTVSGQLNVETHACALSDVYTFGPTFRAENSHTSRHLAEFWMIEPEMCFADIYDDMNLAEDYLKYLIAFALEHCAEDLEFLENYPQGEKGLRARLQHVLESEFVRITYTEAIELLQQEVSKGAKFEEQPKWGMDMGSEHERYLTEKIFQKPTIVRDYPKEIKAFYMKVNPDGRTVAAMDILVPKIGEIIGGSQREETLEMLKQRAVEMGLPLESIWWYLDLRKYGTIKHCGFGLGFERLILFITGIDNIRDVIPFPRHPGKAEF